VKTLSDGRILLTWTCYRARNDLRTGPQFYSLSGDQGTTWSATQSLNVAGFLRHPILELAPDRWLFPLRDQTVIYHTGNGKLTPFGDGRNHGRVPIVRTSHGTLISGAIHGGLRSVDGGKNWQPLRAFPRFHTAGYDLTTLTNGWVVFTMIVYEFGREHERSYRLVVSRDDGRTWAFYRSIEIYNPPHPIRGRGWPRTVQLDENTLGTLFYDFNASHLGGNGLFFVRTPIETLNQTPKPIGRNDRSK
jgi:hypothetical protein